MRARVYTVKRVCINKSNIGYTIIYEIYRTSHIEKIYVCVLIRETKKRSYVHLCKHMDMYSSSAVARNQLFSRAKRHRSK